MKGGGGGGGGSSVASSNKTNASRLSQFGATDGRRIHSTLSSIHRKVKNFKKKHLGAKSKLQDQASCVRCLEEEILPTWQLQPDDLQTYTDFLRLTLRKPLDESTVSSEAFVDLLGLSETAQDFEILVMNESKLKISIVMETYVMKTCNSLKEDGDGDNLKSISQYDTLVQQHKAAIENSLASFEKHLADYGETSRPFLEYIRQGEEISAVMSQACNDVLAVCKRIAAWLADDEAYPEKLEEEMASNSSAKEDLLQRLHQAHQKKESNQAEIDRLHKVEERSGRLYHMHRREKRKLKSRLADLEDRKIYLQNKISKYRQDRADLKRGTRDKGFLTASEQYSYHVRLTDLNRLLERLQDQSRITDKQLRRVTKDMKPAIDTSYEHKVETVTLRHNKENLQKDNRNLDEETKEIQQQIRQLDEFNRRLKKVRELKLSGEAFRKNLRQQHRKEKEYTNGCHDLAEACKAAAPSIGKDWKKVYLCLPFDPPRCLDKLQRDVDILDHIAARNDVTDDVQALKSLEKWRVFNRKCDVMELVEALRQVKKKRLARDLQNKFVGVPV